MTEAERVRAEAMFDELVHYVVAIKRKWSGHTGWTCEDTYDVATAATIILSRVESSQERRRLRAIVVKRCLYGFLRERDRRKRSTVLGERAKKYMASLPKMTLPVELGSTPQDLQTWVEDHAHVIDDDLERRILLDFIRSDEPRIRITETCKRLDRCYEAVAHRLVRIRTLRPMFLENFA